MSVTATDHYVSMSALAAFVSHVGGELEALGQEIDSEHVEKAIHDRFGDSEDAPEYWRAEAQSHELFAVLMRRLADALLQDARQYEELAKGELEQARRREGHA